MADEAPDPVDAAAEILNWEPAKLPDGRTCYACQVYGPSCSWHGVPDLVHERSERFRAQLASEGVPIVEVDDEEFERLKRNPDELVDLAEHNVVGTARAPAEERLRCPVHGAVDPGDTDPPTCPVPVQRTIAGEHAVGTCGAILVD